MMRRSVQTPAIVTISPGYFTNQTHRGQNQGYTGDDSLPTVAYTIDPSVTFVQETRQSPSNLANTRNVDEADNSSPPPAYSSIVKSWLNKIYFDFLLFFKQNYIFRYSQKAFRLTELSSSILDQPNTDN